VAKGSERDLLLPTCSSTLLVPLESSSSNLSTDNNEADNMTTTYISPPPENTGPIMVNSVGVRGECFQTIGPMQKLGTCIHCRRDAHVHCMITIRESGIKYACVSCHRQARQRRARAPITTTDAATASYNDLRSEEIDDFDRFVLRHGERLREYLGNQTSQVEANNSSMSLLSIQ
jgi:hypothetical protein